MSIFGLKIMACFTVFVCGSQDPNQMATNLPPVESSITNEKSEQLQQQIRSLQMSAFNTDSTVQSDALKQTIDQIQSLRLPSEPVKLPDVTTGKPTPPSIQKETDSKHSNTASTEKKNQTSLLTSLDTVEDPLNPVAAADALYRIGDMARAMRFYEKVAEQKSEINVLVRQWAMYQWANCLRVQNPEQAILQYAKLIAEYPNNPWATAAMTQKRSLEWLKQNEIEIKHHIETNASKQ